MVVRFSLFDREEIKKRTKKQQQQKTVAPFRAHPKYGNRLLMQKTPRKRLLCSLSVRDRRSCLPLCIALAIQNTRFFHCSVVYDRHNGSLEISAGNCCKKQLTYLSLSFCFCFSCFRVPDT